jgi:hypothetical protein
MLPYVLGRAAGGGTVLVGKVLNGLAEIPEQVPPVGYLHRGGRPLPDAVGISAGTVTGYDLDTGAIAQPSCNSSCFPVGQEIHHVVGLQVHHHCPVPMSSSPPPIVNPEHSWSSRGRSNA